MNVHRAAHKFILNLMSHGIAAKEVRVTLPPSSFDAAADEMMLLARPGELLPQPFNSFTLNLPGGTTMVFVKGE